MVGPTAVGKTAFSIELAQSLNCGIISADSRQFYRELNIGTAKASSSELAAAPHHFVNTHSIHEHLNAGEFERQSIELLDQLFIDNKYCIVCGGSGLYLNALAYGFDDFAAANPDIRLRLENQLEQKGIKFLQRSLKEKDPDFYKEVDLNNPRRLIRALEVIQTTGKTYSSQRSLQKAKRPFKMVWIGLEMEREKLYERINKRVDLMMEAGLLKEVEDLLPNRDLRTLQTVGYSELFDYFDGKYTLEEAVELIKRNSRRFAKRQLTWFRRNEDINWFEGPALDRALTLIR